MSVNLVNIPSTGFEENEHTCFCSDDLKDHDVVGHEIVDRQGRHYLSHFMDRECAKTWVKTMIRERWNLQGARCPTCRETINVASILSQQEIDECRPNLFQNHPANPIIAPNRLFLNNDMHHDEDEGAGVAISGTIGGTVGGVGAMVTLAAGVGVALSSEPIGFGLAFAGTVVAEFGLIYAGCVANEMIVNKYSRILGASALCAATGSAIGAIGGAPLLTSAVVGVVSPFAIVTVAAAGAAVGAFYGFMKGGA